MSEGDACNQCSIKIIGAEWLASPLVDSHPCCPTQLVWGRRHPVSPSQQARTVLLAPRLLCAKSLQLCMTLRLHGLQPARFVCLWDSPGKNLEVGCHALFQRIFPAQGLNPYLFLMTLSLAGTFFIASTTCEALLAPRIPHVPLFPPLLILFCVLSL